MNEKVIDARMQDQKNKSRFYGHGLNPIINESCMVCKNPLTLSVKNPLVLFCKSCRVHYQFVGKKLVPIQKGKCEICNKPTYKMLCKACTKAVNEMFSKLARKLITELKRRK